MEYQFEIMGRVTQEMHHQLHRILVRPMMKIVNIMFFVCAGCMAFLGWYKQEPVKILTAVFYFLGPVLVWQILKMMANRAYKERVKYYGGETPERVARFGENLVIEEVDSSRTVPYDKITKIHYFQDAVMMMVGMQFAFVVPNKTFAKGSLPELKQFLREKCINAQFFE